LLGASTYRNRYPRWPAGHLISRYIAGERNGPPEDCGGIPGFYDLLDAIADPNPSHAHLKEWAGDYDPATFDSLPIKYALARIANRRNAAKVRLAKKKQVGSAA
jgi:hypothetical protein